MLERLQRLPAVMTKESNDAVFVNRIVRNIYELCIDDITRRQCLGYA